MAQVWNKLVQRSQGKAHDDFLFLNENGNPYNQDKLYRIWKRASRKLGIEISLYQGTRHSRVSQKRLEKEKEIVEACRQELGHQFASTTMEHYALNRRDEIE